MAKLRKNPILFLVLPTLAIFTIGAVIYGVNVFNYHQPLTIQRPVSKMVHDEKTEPITDTSFVKDMHFYAWLPWWDENRVVQSLRTAGNKIEVISPIWYKLADNGTLAQNPALQQTTITAMATHSGLLVFPTVNNESDTGFDAKRVSLLLHNPRLQTLFTASLITEAKTNGYSGWDIDWEEKDANDKDTYSNFIPYLAEQLHQHALKLAVTVQAKTDDSETYGDAKVEDWKTLAASADEIRIMAYDFHYDQSDPGAITPLDDLEAVLAYAKKMVPKDKIVLGVPLYGYDWNQKGGTAIQYDDGMRRIKKYNGTVTRDPASEELVGTYANLIDSHTLWFTDKKSVLRILYIAHNHKVTKIAFWRLGGEDQQLWQLK